MTGASCDDGTRSTARMATPSTKILRLPRIGPVVTLSSVLAGASPIGLSFSLRRCEPDQVQRVAAPLPPLSCEIAAPRGRVVRREKPGGWPAARRRPACVRQRLALARRRLRRLDLGSGDGAVVIGVDLVEVG